MKELLYFMGMQIFKDLLSAFPNRPQPFPKTWWVAEGALLCGCYPGHKDKAEAQSRLQALLEAGVRSFISLIMPPETVYYGGGLIPYEELLMDLASELEIRAEYRNFPIEDMGTPDLETLEQILDRIDKSLKEEKPVYLHCWGGHGRTGTILGCWMIRYGFTGHQALDRIRDLRCPHPEVDRWESPQTAEQRQVILDYRNA